MVRACLTLLLLLPGCGGISYNTTVADSFAVRRAMDQSVSIGQTTEREFMTRWGKPVQKVREGSQIEYIYRDMSDPETHKLFSLGDSSRFVIVTFQYGRAVGVRTNDTERCRATFPARPPGHSIDNPGTVHPISHCPGLLRPDDGSGLAGDGLAEPIFADRYGDAGKAG